MHPQILQLSSRPSDVAVTEIADAAATATVDEAEIEIVADAADTAETVAIEATVAETAIVASATSDATTAPSDRKTGQPVKIGPSANSDRPSRS